MSGCCAPTFGTAGPRLPGGRGRGSPVPTQSPILSVALHARRFDPERQLRAPTPRATKPRMHAGVSVPRRTPNYPRGADRKPPRRYRTGKKTLGDSRDTQPVHARVQEENARVSMRKRALLSVFPTRGGRPGAASRSGDLGKGAASRQWRRRRLPRRLWQLCSGRTRS